MKPSSTASLKQLGTRNPEPGTRNFPGRHPILSCLFCSVTAFFITTETLFYYLGEPPLHRDPEVALGYSIVAGIIIFSILFDVLYLKGGRVESGGGTEERRADSGERSRLRIPLFALLSTLFLFSSTPAMQAAEEPPQEPAPALLIGGAVVVVIGGIIFWKATRKCEKIARERTNNWPEELRFKVAGGDGADPSETAAAFSWAEYGYCTAERQWQPVIPVTFTLDIAVQSASNATLTVQAYVGETFVQTFLEYREQLAGHGLALATAPGLFESYARNRHPVAPEQVPITFDWPTRTIRVGAGGVLVAVERSADLVTWETVGRINVAPDSRLSLPDVSERAATFWRVKTTERED